MRRWHLAIWGIMVMLCACLSGYAAETTSTPAGPAGQVKEDDYQPFCNPGNPVGKG